MSRGARHGRSKPVRERRCVATGEVKGEEDLLRVALSPEGRVTPDVAARLPGRGGWVTADRALVDKAVKKRLFNRAFEQPVEAPDDLADQFEALLKARVLNLLGLARRAGRLELGSDAVRLALQSEPGPAWRLEASDAAPDGRKKLDHLAKAIESDAPVLGCYDADALSRALGVGNAVHGALAQGPEAAGISALASKLAGFVNLDPAGLGAQKS